MLRNRQAKRVNTDQLTLADRVVFAIIGGFFGSLMGAVFHYGIQFAAQHALTTAALDIVVFSAVYFGLVGFTAGVRLGDFCGAAVSGLLDILTCETSIGKQSFSGRNTFRPVWITVLFAIWLAGIVAIYLRG